MSAMHISKINICNFRLLRKSTLDLRENLSLLVGKNNTGKTSLLVLFEKFFCQKKFNFNDFSVSLREQILSIDKDTDVDDLSIRLILEIEYNEKDDLENLSVFILDLNPDITKVKILFECSIDKGALLKALTGVERDEREKKVIKILDRYLTSKIYVFDDSEHDGESDYFKENRHKLIEKEQKNINDLINVEIIHARRNVASSEESSDKKKPLSTITTAYFNNKHDAPENEFSEINTLLANIDSDLEDHYKSLFSGFLASAVQFLDLKKLNVVSNIQAKMLFDNSSQVIYGHGSDGNHLPEQFNGLGYVNILYLLLQIEIKKEEFKSKGQDINLLFIEEPEAHTHPQMQYIFATEIANTLKVIPNLQTLITSHSSHIVSQSDFEDIRYLRLDGDSNIEFKNFHTDLKQKYSSEPNQFKFLKQYLNIQSAELFFASKVIFIEGITERMLLPYFIQNFDKKNKIDKDRYTPLASHNISILEVGANAKAFAPFLEFLDIKTLIITDIDATKKTMKTTVKSETTTYPASQVAESTHTSNETIKYFFKSPPEDSDEYQDWFINLRNHSQDSIHANIKVAYQREENGYFARSFEDSFICLNIDRIKEQRDDILGIKNKSTLNTYDNFYTLTEAIIDKKSAFAASILYLALSHDDISWKTPSYIKESLSWIWEE